METPDVIIAGAGIIGLSLAIELRGAGASVMVLDRGEPGREASSAAAGMLVTADPDTPPRLKPLADASAALYPAFVEELEAHSGNKVGYERRGALYVADQDERCPLLLPLTIDELRVREPLLIEHPRVYLLDEQSVDPRRLVRAAVAAAKRKGVIVHHEAKVESVSLTRQHQLQVQTARGTYITAAFVNCAGAWAAGINGAPVRTRPVKGQMLAVIPTRELRHVIRSHAVYLLPRKDCRLLIGATVEESGFDKKVDPAAIQKLLAAAAELVPAVGQAKIIDAWAGLRPGSLDGLPILGPLELPGTYTATGHFRNGILLAPITAVLMSELIQGRQPRLDLRPFAPSRFATSEVVAG